MSPRRSRRTRLTATSFSYREDDDSGHSSDSEDEPDLFGNILGLFMQNMMRKVSGGRRRTRQPKTKTPKRRRTATQGPCCGQPHCAANMFGRHNTPTTASAGPSRHSHKKGPVKSRAPTVTLCLDSDDDTKIPDTQTKDMTSRIDSFFKEFESGDDGYEKKFKKDDKYRSAPVVKNRSFYAISDDDDEIAEVSNSSSHPGTSVLNSSLNTSTASSKADERKKEDLFTFVDSMMKSDDVEFGERQSENGKVETLEDLRRETEEILGSVSTLIDELNPEKKQGEQPQPVEEPPEVPSCPVCFEPFGENLQRMVTMCGHMFCEPCIRAVATTIKKCPTCRKTINSKMYHAIYL